MSALATAWLHLRAPFAAFRWMQAGVYRATSPVIPPSAAWGLVLNLAHIDTRDSTLADAGKSPVTGIRADAPALCLAIGSRDRSEKSTLYQQLHSYPVGASGKELAPRTRGAKYWIAPVRRELLVGFECVLGVRAEAELLARVERGLRGQLTGTDSARYGLPFAGDNNLLFDRIDFLAEPLPAIWYAPVARDAEPRRGSCRLTVAIDRHDSAATRSPLFAPTSEPTAAPPDDAWVWCPRAPGAEESP